MSKKIVEMLDYLCNTLRWFKCQTKIRFYMKILLGPLITYACNEVLYLWANWHKRESRGNYNECSDNFSIIF